MKTPKYISNSAEKIRSLNPLDQVVKFKNESWQKFFLRDRELISLIKKYPTEISRGNVVSIAKDISSNPSDKDLRRLFMAVMLWGFGSTGYGAYRTHEMMKAPGFSRIIAMSFKMIREGDIAGAYDAFDLKWCGPAFFSKFFYFAGANTSLEFKPIILDSVVARSLEENCKCDVTLYVRASRQADGRAISSLKKYKDGYINYIKDMTKWAKRLDIKPEQIELYLFRS